MFKDNKLIKTYIPGNYAGWKKGKIFGLLTCKSGIRKMRKENRVFFHSLEDAVRAGYRPCKICRPMNKDDFERINYLISHTPSLEEFYNK